MVQPVFEDESVFTLNLAIMSDCEVPENFLQIGDYSMQLLSRTEQLRHSYA